MDCSQQKRSSLISEGVCPLLTKIMTTTTNLVEFWTVQRQSGEHSHIFLSLEQAQETYDNWRKAVFEKFKKWERGESSFAGVTSTLEADCWGGCYQSYSVADYCLPNGIYHHSIGSTYPDKWEECEGFDCVKWGNLATERPSKPSTKKVIPVRKK